MGNLNLLGVGHSWVSGTASGNPGVVGNSYRREMYYRFRSKYGIEPVFVGDQTSGDIPTPYHDGWPGMGTDFYLLHLNDWLDAAFPSPTADDCVIFGPATGLDCINQMSLTTFNSNMTALMNMIDAHSPLIKILLVTQPNAPTALFHQAIDISDYVAEEKAVYTAANAAGKNIYLIDANAHTIHIPIATDPIPGDGLHPDWLGYGQLGDYMTDDIASALGISEGISHLLFQDNFTDIDATALASHTPDVNETGDVWHDPNSRFAIYDNTAKGVGGYAYDTYIDLGQVVWSGQVKLFASVNGTTFCVLKANSTMSRVIYFWINTATQKLWIGNESSAYSMDAADFTCVDGVWYTFDIEMTGNFVIISNNGIQVIKSLPSDYGNFTRFGLSYYPAGVSEFDSLTIYRGLADPLFLISVSDDGAGATALQLLNQFTLGDTGAGATALQLLNQFTLGEDGSGIESAILVDALALVEDGGGTSSGEGEEVGVSAAVLVSETVDATYKTVRKLTDTFAGPLGWLQDHTPDFSLLPAGWIDWTGTVGMVVNGGRAYNGTVEMPPYYEGFAQCYIDHGCLRYTVAFDFSVGIAAPPKDACGIYLRASGSGSHFLFWYRQDHFEVTTDAGTVWTDYSYPENATYAIRLVDTYDAIQVWIDGILKVTLPVTVGQGNTRVMFYAPWYNPTQYFENFTIDGTSPIEDLSIEATAGVSDSGASSEGVDVIDIKNIPDYGGEPPYVEATFPGGSQPLGVTTCAGSVWTNGQYPGTVVRMDPLTGAIQATISLGVSSAMGLASDGTYVYVSSSRYIGGAIRKIDPATNTVVATSAEIQWAECVACGGGFVWTTNSANLLYKLNPADLSTAGTLNLGSYVSRVVFDYGYVWVKKWGSSAPYGWVMKVDPTAMTLKAAIVTGFGNSGDICSGGGFIWVTFYGTGYKIDPTLETVVGNFPAGYKISIFHGNFLWVLDNAGDLRKIDPSTCRVVYVLSVGSYNQYGICSGLGFIWLAQNSLSSVAKIAESDGEHVFITWDILINELGTSKGHATFVERFDEALGTNVLLHTGDAPNDPVWVYDSITHGDSWPLTVGVEEWASGTIEQTVSGLTPGDHYFFSFDILQVIGTSYYSEMYAWDVDEFIGYGYWDYPDVGTFTIDFIAPASGVVKLQVILSQDIAASFIVGHFELAKGVLSLVDSLVDFKSTDVYIEDILDGRSPDLNEGSPGSTWSCDEQFLLKNSWNGAWGTPGAYRSYASSRAFIGLGYQAPGTYLARLWCTPVPNQLQFCFIDLRTEESGDYFIRFGFNYPLFQILSSNTETYPGGVVLSQTAPTPNYVGDPGDPTALYWDLEVQDVGTGFVVLVNGTEIYRFDNGDYDRNSGFGIYLGAEEGVGVAAATDVYWKVLTETQSSFQPTARFPLLNQYDMEAVNWELMTVTDPASSFMINDAISRSGGLVSPTGWAAWRFRGSVARGFADITLMFEPIYGVSEQMACAFRWTDAGGYVLYHKLGIGLYLQKSNTADLVSGLSVITQVPDPGTPAAVRIELLLGSISVYFDNVLVLSAVDTDHAAGSVGFLVNAGTWDVRNFFVDGMAEGTETLIITSEMLVDDVNIDLIEDLAVYQALLQTDSGVGVDSVMASISGILVEDKLVGFSENFDDRPAYSNNLLHTGDAPGDFLWTYFNLSHVGLNWPITLLHFAGNPTGYLEQTTVTNIARPMTLQFKTGNSWSIGPSGMILTLELHTSLGSVSKGISTSPGPGEELLQLNHLYSVSIDLTGPYEILDNARCRLYLNPVTPDDPCQLEIEQFQLSKTIVPMPFIPTTDVVAFSNFDMETTDDWEQVLNSGATWATFFAVDQPLFGVNGQITADGSAGFRYKNNQWDNYTVHFNYAVGSTSALTFGFRWGAGGAYVLVFSAARQVYIGKTTDPGLHSGIVALSSVEDLSPADIPFTVRVEGNRIRVWKGTGLTKIFDITDSDFTRGTFGFIREAGTVAIDTILVEPQNALEALSIFAQAMVADNGYSVSEVMHIINSLLVSDSGSGLDAVSIVSFVRIGEYGTSSLEALGVNAWVLVNDAGHATEAIVIGTGLMVTDTATGSDLIRLLVSFLISDSGTEIAETVNVLGYLHVMDQGTIHEALQIFNWFTLQEGVQGTEALSIFVKLLVDDTSVTTEEVMHVLAFLNVQDFGIGDTGLSVIEIFKMLDILYLESHLGRRLDLKSRFF